MKSRYLIDRFQERRRKGLPLHPPCAGMPNMTVFGSDEFRIDRRRGAIHLLGVGWIDCAGLAGTRGRPDWVGIVHWPSGAEAVPGHGDPFADGGPVVPHALIRAMSV